MDTVSLFSAGLSYTQVPRCKLKYQVSVEYRTNIVQMATRLYFDWIKNFESCTQLRYIGQISILKLQFNCIDLDLTSTSCNFDFDPAGENLELYW